MKISVIGSGNMGSGFVKLLFGFGGNSAFLDLGFVFLLGKNT